MQLHKIGIIYLRLMWNTNLKFANPNRKFANR